MQVAEPPVNQHPQQPALLRCLLQLGDQACAQFLLPKLDKGSAAVVALTCSQLRKISHGTKQSLDLRWQLDTADTSSLRLMQRNLPLHFPSCSAVSVELASDKCYHNMPYLLPALASLQQLDGLSLTLTLAGSGPMQRLLACTMLVSMRVQLPCLRGLTLTLHQPQSCLAAVDVHRELGDMTQLTQLCLNLGGMQVEQQAQQPIQYAGAHHLSSLTQLEHLTIWADWDNPKEWYLDGCACK